jgi:hypothetical protein
MKIKILEKFSTATANNKTDQMLSLTINNQNKYKILFLDVHDTLSIGSFNWNFNLNPNDYEITSVNDINSYSTEIYNRISGISANNSTQYYRKNAYEYWLNGITAPTYSSTSWLAGITLTGMPLKTGSSPNESGRGCLITNKHLISARHFPTGGTVKFLNNNNQIITATIIATKPILPFSSLSGDVSQFAFGTPDFVIHRLSADVDPSITPLHIMAFPDSPDDLLYKLFGGVHDSLMFGIRKNDKIKLGVLNINSQGIYENKNPYIAWKYNLDSSIISSNYELLLNSNNEPGENGDSSSSLFVLHKNSNTNTVTPVVLGLFNTSSGGQFIFPFISQIKNAIDEWGDTSYKLKLFYNTYIPYG